VIPVIDIFAGPGGLGEGFSSLRSNGQTVFRIALSIEKDAIAHKTLLLRSFFRQFQDGAPAEYYSYIQAIDNKVRKKYLTVIQSRYPDQWKRAEREALNVELGKYPTLDLDDKILAALKNAKTWILIGGPPCQAYSLVGRSRMSRNQEQFKKDPRHFLYKEYLGIIAAHLPPVFVMENVKGLLSSTIDGGYIIERIFSDLREPRKAMPKRECRTDAASDQYEIHPIVSYGEEPKLFEDISAKDYVVRSEMHGIPQARHRLILVGIRKDLIEGGALLGKLDVANRIPKMWEAICDLPQLRSQLSKEKDSAALWRMIVARSHRSDIVSDPVVPVNVRCKIRQLSKHISAKLTSGSEFLPGKIVPTFRRDWYYDSQLKGVCNHSSRGHIQEDLWRYFYAACYAKVVGDSPKLGSFPKVLQPKHKSAKPSRNGGVKFEDRFRVQVSKRPSSTITSHISKDGHYFIHPDPLQCRSLTVREAARLQTFPDNYFFEGPRTEQYHQVGNAVPPLLANQIAHVVFKLLERK
jgi:DNA (cytosine-5)-methyltransferase 1